MNNFDKQRIENAIWILEQHYYDVKCVMLDCHMNSADCNRLFAMLGEVKEYIKEIS